MPLFFFHISSGEIAVMDDVFSVSQILSVKRPFKKPCSISIPPPCKCLFAQHRDRDTLCVEPGASFPLKQDVVGAVMAESCKLHLAGASSQTRKLPLHFSQRRRGPEYGWYVQSDGRKER